MDEKKDVLGWAEWNGMLTELNCIVGKTFFLHLMFGISRITTKNKAAKGLS